MGSGGDEGPIRGGDKAFLVRLIGGVAVVFLLGAMVLALLDRSRLGTCAARGFEQLTDAPPSD